MKSGHNTLVKWISKEKKMILTKKMILDESNPTKPLEERIEDRTLES